MTLDESPTEHSDTPAASRALDERLDPRENPRLAEIVGEEAAQAFLGALLTVIQEEERSMNA